MNNKETPQVTAAILLSCAGIFMVFGMPFFVGGLISELGFTQAQANLISSAEIAGMALSSLLGAAWIGRFNWRHVALFALFAVLAGNLFSFYVENFQVLVATRFITGLVGHGTAFALGVAAIGNTSQPDRNFGFTIASQVAMGALTALIVPKTIAIYGIAGMCAPAAILAVVAMAFIPRLATSGHAQTPDSNQSKRTGILILPLLGLLVMIIWQMGVGPFFNNLVPYGISIELDPSDIGTALFLSTGLSIIGPLTASALANKINRNVPVCIALTAQLLIILSFQGDITWIGFTVRAILFQTAWNFTGPFLMGMIANLDESGRYSVLIPASQLGGIALGHAVIASLVQGSNLILVNYFCAGAIFLSIFLFVLVSGKINKEKTQAS
jgi:predicted MFS family arabinose efflux permease|tara:strand:+ start:322 stop:1473 length:1152 start_codon:yes stop_codon:yes gene_type:complete